MPGERLPPDSPREWINRARSDLAIASSQISGAYLEDLCYHAQQACEKALKALLIAKRGRFPRSHDLSELINLVSKVGVDVPEFVKDAAALTIYAVEGRYPGLDEPVSQEEFADATFHASRLVDWVESQLLLAGQ